MAQGVLLCVVDTAQDAAQAFRRRQFGGRDAGFGMGYGHVHCNRFLSPRCIVRCAHTLMSKIDGNSRMQ